MMGYFGQDEGAEGGSEKPFRFPAFNMWAGDGYFPIEYLPKQYKFYTPYIVTIPVTIPANDSIVAKYNQPNDSDFVIYKTFSAIFVDQPLFVSIRIPNVIELMNEPVFWAAIFPPFIPDVPGGGQVVTSSQPFFWETGLFVQKGESLEVNLINNGTSDTGLDLVFQGMRLYD